MDPRDSGVEAVVGFREGSKLIVKAEEQGPEVASIADAVAQVGVVMVLVPDQSQRAIWVNDIESNLKEDAVVFSVCGFNVHYDYIKPGLTHDVCTIIPGGPGHTARRLLEEGRGVSSPVCTEQDASGQTFELALLYAAAIGAIRAGVVKTIFHEGAEIDLFDEQTILCGDALQFIQYGLGTFAEVGYQPEMAYSEACHEMKLIVDLIDEGGLMKQRWSYSDTVEYGDYVSGPRVTRPNVRDHMKEAPVDIQNGSFAEYFIDDRDVGTPEPPELRVKGMVHPIGKTEQEIRKLFAWNSLNLDENYADGEAAR